MDRAIRRGLFTAFISAAAGGGPSIGQAQLEARAQRETLSVEPHAQRESDEISYRFVPGPEKLRLIGTSLRSERRHGETLDRVSATAAYDATPAVRVEGKVLGSSSAAVGIERGAEVSLQTRIAQDWSVATAVGGTQRADASTTVSRLQLNRDLGRWRFSAGVAQESSASAAASSMGAGATTAFGGVRYVSGNWSVALGYSDATPTAPGATAALPPRMRSSALTLGHALKSSWQLNASLVQSLSGPLSTGLRIGVSHPL